ncbi:LIC11966 family surface protein [Parvicella tangerina]|uniref:Uncharacterized protein n=1 Tax=Parvicella tangerina TaxID=2829795 RepID=A0A916JN69_9FLAO|nr:hypothetical protein [Parvicella tangerina]CAG5083455.1 hypothetical protein CRYO30217_02200 [Parvicella tangerina]
MKTLLNKKIRLTFLFLLLCSASVFGQEFSNPVEYMNFIGEQYAQLTEDQWAYTRAIANDKKAKKIESKRQDLLNSNKSAQAKIKKMPAYNGNTEYRDSVVAFLQLNYDVLNNDYAKIVDMEEIAEQSYDLMEAYLLAQEVASEKLKSAGEMLSETEKKFAADNDITLQEGEKSKNAKRLEKANKVYKYYNEIYLIFFKCYKQEAYLLDAVNTGDVNAMEQNKNALLTYANEGLDKLKKLKAFEGDNSLIEAGKEILDFYKDEAENELGDIVDFFVKKEKFETINEAFEAKKKNKRTQEDVDNFNQAVNDYNAATEAYNKANEILNKSRGKKLDNWNNTATKFTKKNV